MYHTSNPNNRESILKTGLIPSFGDQRCFGNELKDKAVFLTLLEPFNSTFNDDLYWVEIEHDSMEVDTAMEDSYIYYKIIPVSQIKLLVKGTGQSEF